MAASKPRPDERSSEVAALEAELDRKEQELSAVIEQYEQVIDTRARLRRGTRADETFVWTGERADTEEEPTKLRGLLASLF